jgi:hypothetical protein
MDETYVWVTAGDADLLADVCRAGWQAHNI